jgi:superfamily II DNA or RNA helicase
MGKIYQLPDGRRFELIATGYSAAKDNPLQEMAIFRRVNGTRVFVMPFTDFEAQFSSSQTPTTIKPSLTSEQIQLFMTRFAGRPDVYAERKYSKKYGKDIYFPAGPFHNGQRIKGTYFPLTATVIKNHLLGRAFIGIYPLLDNDQTNLLALDIDSHDHAQKNWQLVAKTIIKICRREKIPFLLEISQSGAGCHFWFLFAQPIAAQRARQLGTALLKAAMAINPDISFSAFDRMFPSQDFASKKGLGNLIALPLQGQRLAHHHSVFVDDQFTPLPDQWQTLQAVTLLTEQAVQNHLAQLTSQDTFPMFEITTELKQNELYTIPAGLRIIRRNILLIEKGQLTRKQITALQWLATFYNPEFFKREKQRLPVTQIPPIISLAENKNNYLGLPRGLEDYLQGAIPSIQWDDQTIIGVSMAVTFNGELRAEQKIAEGHMLKHHMGVLAARTGFGKTVIGAKLIADRQVSTLILVNNKELARQWYEQLNQFLTIQDESPIKEYTPSGRLRKKKSIGRLYGNTNNRSGLVDIATIQSLQTDDRAKKVLADYGMIIYDEVHHLPAFTYENVIKQAKARYIYGLSATPYRRDGLDPIIAMRMGAIRYQTDKIDTTQAAQTNQIVYPRYTNLGALNFDMAANTIQDNFEAMMNDSERTRLIVADIQRNLAENRHILVLTQRIEHLTHIQDNLQGKIDAPIFPLFGQQTAKMNAENIDKIHQTSSSYVILATGKFVGEGFDVASIDTLLLAMPVSWRGTVEQYLGRMQRNLAAKKEIRVYDYVDVFIPMLARMFNKRKSTYRQLGYQLVEDEYANRTHGKMWDGQYQTAMLKDRQSAGHSLVIASNDVSGIFMQQLMTSPAPLTMTLISKDTAVPQGFNGTKLTSRASLPNVLILDDQVVWFCSDIAFQANSGLAIRIANQQLASQLQAALLSSGDRLPGL